MTRELPNNPAYVRGYMAYPTSRGYPKAGTKEESQFLKGWHDARKENMSDSREYFVEGM